MHAMWQSQGSQSVVVASTYGGWIGDASRLPGKLVPEQWLCLVQAAEENVAELSRELELRKGELTRVTAVASRAVHREANSIKEDGTVPFNQHKEEACLRPLRHKNLLLFMLLQLTKRTQEGSRRGRFGTAEQRVTYFAGDASEGGDQPPEGEASAG